MPPTVTLVDVVADAYLGQLFSAADGAVVISVETLADSLLTAAHLIAADVPSTERGLALAPLGPA